MGSCISKCSKPKKKILMEEDCSHIHDKLVISQNLMISSLPSNITTIPPQKPLISQAPSTSSSFSCSTNSKCTVASSSSTTTTTSSSSSSCSSSLSTTKDRSFSNEFLRSCVKDNPHVISLINKPTAKEKSTTSGNKIHPQDLEAKMKQYSNEENDRIMIRVSSSPRKRARANSPTLVRQKSLRREHNSSSSATSIPNRGLLRSPSPGRRLSNGDNVRGFAMNGNNSVNYGVKRESFQSSKTSPNRDMTISSRNFSLKKNDTISRKIGAKMDIIGHGQELIMDDIVMDDINNPLIALDCFIFL